MLFTILTMLLVFKNFIFIGFGATIFTIFVLKEMHAQTPFGKKLINFFDFNDEI